MDNLFFKEEHKMVQNMVCDFARSEIRPIAKELDKNGSFPIRIVKKMGQPGLIGINVHTKYGDSDLDTVACLTAIIELAKVDASVAFTMASHTSLRTLPLLLFGNKRLKKKYLPKVASGEIFLAYGLAEPHADSDTKPFKTKAIKVEGKYIINGSKIFITTAREAGLLSFISRVVEKGHDKGLGLFRDAKILEIVEGTSEIQRLTISREIVKDKMA